MPVYNLIQIRKVYAVRRRAQLLGDRELFERDSSYGFIYYGDANLMVVNHKINAILSQYGGARFKASTSIEKVNTLAETYCQRDDCLSAGPCLFPHSLWDPAEIGREYS